MLIMKENRVKFKEYQLENGIVLQNVEVVYHTSGTFNENENNVIWICHALTANSDASDWWPTICGEHGYFNEDEHFVICANILGSCYGTTGPLSSDENGVTYFDEFPQITIRDIFRLHEKLRLHLGINKINTLVGASLGGQQAMEWAIEKADLFENLILIATNAQHSPYGIAFNESQRLAIEADSTYFLKKPNGGRNGLIAARSIALLSYRSYEGYLLSQNETVTNKVNQFKAAHYQRYQGEKLADRFNAYSYVALSKAMDSHNVGRERGNVKNALNAIKAKTLIIGITSDVLFPLKEQLTLFQSIPNSIYRTIKSNFGHDGFLIEYESLINLFDEFYSYSKSNSLLKIEKGNIEVLFTA
jgi:homoserine O-acetyltransferase